MNCEYCGKKLVKTYKFCPDCGARIMSDNFPETSEVKDTHENKIKMQNNEEKDKVKFEAKSKESRVSGLGIAGFVLSILGIDSYSILIFSLLGLIFSVIAFKQSKIQPLKCKGLYTAGLIISIIGVSLFVINLIFRVLPIRIIWPII